MEKYRMSEEQERGRPPLDLLPGEVASSEVQDGDASGGTRVGTAKNETSDAIEKPTILKKDQKSLKYVSAPQLNLDKKDADELSAMMMASKMAKKDDQTPELVANDAGEIEESPVSPMFSAMAQANQSRGGHRTSESDILAHQGVRVVLPWDQAALPQKKVGQSGKYYSTSEPMTDFVHKHTNTQIDADEIIRTFTHAHAHAHAQAHATIHGKYRQLVSFH
jgi:hypothetical protein